MTKIKFKFDKNKDISNIWKTCSSKAYGFDFSSRMPKDLVDFCRKNSYNKSKKFIEKYFKNIYESGQIELYTKTIAIAWKKIEKKYFKILKNITKKDLIIKDLTCYVTLAPRCPYSLEENFFMVNFFSSIPQSLQTIGHETMHFHFHENYFKDVSTKIGDKKTHMLKESLTVLLNLEFLTLWFIQDRGYEDHKELRSFIVEKWKSSKDFNKLIDECIIKLTEVNYVE